MTGLEVRRLRLRLDLTQEAFARKLGVHRVTVSRWERGTTKPQGAALRALQESLEWERIEREVMRK